MKTLAIILLFILTSTTPPVTGLSYVYVKDTNKYFLNLGWGTSLNSTEDYYNTIRRNGVIIVDGYYNPINRISLEVPFNHPGGNYSVTQTYNGVESQPTYVIVPKIKKGNQN